MSKPWFIVIIIISLCFVESLYAQTISVKSFRKLENDCDARTAYPKMDKNGEKSALIKIVTSETGFEFDGGTLGIAAAELKTGEYWLYVPQGAKTITLKHDKLGILRNYIYPEPIVNATEYEMILTTNKLVTTVVANEIETQWLLITSEPAEADVYINDQPAGKTPYQNELPVGKYNWRVQKELYLNDAGVIELVSGTQKQKLVLKLKPNFGTLQVSTSPEEGASITLNGMESGKQTPCSFEKVPVGDHTLTLSREMYETTTKRITLAAGETQKLAVTMNPTFAEVSVTTDPKADVYINGQYKANSTWNGRLNPGIYTFEGKLDKYNTATEKQTVTIGQPLNLKLSPTPKTGNLKIMSTPFEASIKINGKDYGTTPNTLKNLLIGEYTVELSLAGYATSYEKVTIAEGQTVEVSASLQNGRQVSISSTPTGASLTIDGKPAGPTPFNGSLTFGNHTLRIEQDGKQTEKQVIMSQTCRETNFFLSFELKTFTETVKGVSFDMAAIMGGTFQMGSEDDESQEKPVHSVTVSDFYICKTEVTQSLWQAVMDNNPSYFKGDGLPVERVSWDDAQDFIKKLNHLTGKNYRLPTEAEWEYAAGCGAIDRTKYAGTSNESNLENYAWYSSNSDSKTQPVGQKQPNGLGLYDMSGNVLEWCSDWYSSYCRDNQTNPQGPSTGSYRVARGGDWLAFSTYSRVTHRDYHTPDYCSSILGFRMVLVP
jgi:formylglycine-generating enzyme required for sulfatase activity